MYKLAVMALLAAAATAPLVDCPPPEARADPGDQDAAYVAALDAAGIAPAGSAAGLIRAGHAACAQCAKRLEDGDPLAARTIIIQIRNDSDLDLEKAATAFGLSVAYFCPSLGRFIIDNN